MSSAAPMQRVKSLVPPQKASHSDQLTSQQIKGSAPRYIDPRPQVNTQRKMQGAADACFQSQQCKATQRMAHQSVRTSQLKKIGSQINANLDQGVADNKTIQTRTHKSIAQLEANANNFAVSKPNNTGLPDNLKSGIESLSGMSMDHVKVHYNSPQPAQLNAHAYAQGSEIHVAPGQEQHLPHEAWHVVQQAQGRVKPTMQMKTGCPVNDDAGLEAEADAMSTKALQLSMQGAPTDKSNSPPSSSTKPKHLCTNPSVQRKIFIENKPYSFQEESQRLHGSGSNEQHTFTPNNKAKARAWSSDSWKRYYNDVAEFQDHSSGVPVNVGVFESLGLWYELPFRTGRPFVLGENHSTKVTPIMRESNRRGSILHESNGVIPIKSKKMAQKPDAPAGFHRTAMESVVAKTLFGVVYHTAPRMKPKTPPNHVIENSTTWIEHYAAADDMGKGRDNMQRPYYTNEDGRRVIQGDNPNGEYSSINTMKRVKEQFDEEAGTYIAHSQKEKAKNFVIDLKARLNTWWDNMLEISELYKAPELNMVRINELQTAIREQRPGLILRFTNMFNSEYENEIIAKPEKGDGGLEKRKIEARAAGLDESLIDAVAMRDLAMLTVILNTQDWGDHEMISMGEKHAQTLKGDIESRAGLTVISRDDFISNSKSAL